MRTRSRPRRRLLYCRRAGALQLGVVPLDAAKFDHRDDPGGHPGLGFQRLPEPPHTLEVDPATIGVAVGLFERCALGNVSAKDLAAETGLAETRIRMILMNPIYNGWIRRWPRPRRGGRVHGGSRVLVSVCSIARAP